MKLRVLFTFTFVVAVTAQLIAAENPFNWTIHDMNRPRPAIVSPATPSTQEKPGQPPSDAIVLFDGTSFDNWRTGNDLPPKWRLGDGYMECVPDAGSIYTVEKFGSCQLHVEWSAPYPPRGNSQGRGNSGVYLMGLYEVQVLDSYENITYADGQAAAIYGEYPPLVNACRKPGEWQTYDIVFHQPQFNARGEVIKPATVTLFHNGVLVQDHVELTGPTMNRLRIPYYRHEDKRPLLLQNHHNPVRYRNIWIRPLADEKPQVDGLTVAEVDEATLDDYVGKYQVNDDWIITVKKENGKLRLYNAFAPSVLVQPQSDHAFFSDVTSVNVDFTRGRQGRVSRIRIFQGAISVSGIRMD